MAVSNLVVGITVLILGITSVQTVAHPDLQLTKFQSSPGLYYDNMGKVSLYSVTWRIVSYFNLVELNNKFESTEILATRAVEFCQRRLALLNMSAIECASAKHALQWHIGKIEKAQSLIGQLARHERRSKRGILNFVGEISKILFGTLDEDDASYFKSKIDVLEGEQKQLLRLSREQVTIVKATLTSFNHTVSSIARNEEIITQGMKKLSQHVIQFENSTDKRLQRAVILITINEQLIQLTSIFNELEREYDLLITAIVNAQKGILEPHLINPVQVVKYMELIKEDIKDKRFPIALAGDNGYQLLKVIDLDVFIAGNILSYVLNIPLVDSSVFDMYKIWPLPVEVNAKKQLFTYIAPEKEILLIDDAKRQYVKLNNDQLLCKKIDQNHRVCKQTFVLLSTYDHEMCEARMLQPVTKIPGDCIQKYIVLNESVWTQIRGNEWLFVAPKDEGLTVLCNDNTPTDVVIRGTGKLKFMGKCRGYGAQILIQSEHIIRTNVTNKDIVPNLNMDIDCCVVNQEKRNITELTLNLPVEHVVRQLDDLNAAGHKLDELENEILYQQRTAFNGFSLSSLPVWSYFGSSIVIVIIILCICKHCKCCRDCFRFLFRTMGDDCCGKICIKNKIVNQYPNREFVRYQPARRDVPESEEIVIERLPTRYGSRDNSNMTDERNVVPTRYFDDVERRQSFMLTSRTDKR